MDATPPPAWVQKRDGRLEPFDADKISRALFAASESLGRPDAFLARELTDGAVHFLSVDADGATPATNQIAELVEKVVRELGQPALATAYAGGRLRRVLGPPPTAAAAADAPRVAETAQSPADAPLETALSERIRAFTLQTVFARDLVAAQADGLLTLTGLDAPGELAACVLGPPGKDGLLAGLEQARRNVGGQVVLDGPEYVLAHSGRTTASDLRAFGRELALGLRLTRLRAVVSLNNGAPPPWAGDLAEGPLFAGRRTAPTAEQLAQLAERLAQELPHSESAGERMRIDWRLAERDFEPEAAERLTRLARLALEGEALGFVFDRPRRPVLLAEGVDRQNPAVLLTVGVHLPRLAEQAGVEGDQAAFLKKLGSLARLALSAAVQKREFLRRQERAAAGPPVTSGFLLDRARLVAAPVGLDAVVAQFTGRGMCSGGSALEFGKQIVQTLRDVLRKDGGLTRLATCVDGPDGFRLGSDGPTFVRVAGLTPWDAAAPMKNQLRAAGALHAVAERGTMALFLPADPRPTAETAADCLRQAWHLSDVSRVRLLLGAPSSPQPAFATNG
jgi:hypothetical protein